LDAAAAQWLVQFAHFTARAPVGTLGLKKQLQLLFLKKKKETPAWQKLYQTVCKKMALGNCRETDLLNTLRFVSFLGTRNDF
jgi:hypothetical protein